MARKKQALKKAAPKKTSAKKTAGIDGVSKAKCTTRQQESRQAITPERRHGLIAEAAYLLAERRGFHSEEVLDDWLQAEAEVDALLSARG